MGIKGLESRLRALGYDQSRINWLLVRHMQCGTLDVLIAEIERMEGNER